MWKSGFIIALISMIILTGCGSSNNKRDNAEGDTNPLPVDAKYVALTFDDGPNSSMTPLVIDKLDYYGVTATFFVIGQNITEETRNVMDSLVSRGFELGNHSWGYDSLDSKSGDEVAKSINDTTQAIIDYTGLEPKFFRPANLATSQVMFDTIQYPFASGVLGFDWTGGAATPQEVADNILNNIQDGSIILLHDNQPHPHPTPDALDIIIPKLQEQGYEFVTLSQLFMHKGIEPQAHDGKMWVTVE